LYAEAVEGKSDDPHWYSRILTPDEFRQLVAGALAGERHKKAWIGMIEPSAADRIRALCGKSVTKIMVESDSIWHSYKKGQHNLHFEDIFCVTDVINTASFMERSAEGNQNNEVIKFRKDSNGLITFVMEIRVKYEGWLALVTCYRLKKVR
jgi:hypothetical protein